MTIFERLQHTIAATLKVAPTKITKATGNENLLAWDSLGQVNLIIALEQEFGVYVEIEDFGDLNSVSGVLAYLEKQGVS